jgi:hypothetical protein
MDCGRKRFGRIKDGNNPYGTLLSRVKRIGVKGSAGADV